MARAISSVASNARLDPGQLAAGLDPAQSERDLLDDRGFDLRPGEAIMSRFLEETAQA
jgi:hypothetical protein